MKIVFRADAGEGIGDGHLSRDLALAEALRAKGADVVLLTRPGASHSRNAWQEAGLEIVTWNFQPGSNEDANTVAEFIKSQAADLLVVDHYAFGCGSLDALFETTRIALFDDLAQINPKVDLVINQNPGAESRYAQSYTQATDKALGSAFCCLRKGVVQQPPAPRTDILIAFGNAQPGNVSAEIVETLARTGTRLNVVLPQTCERPDYSCVSYLAPQDFAPLLAAAKVAIIGGGVTSLEACYLGTPSVILPISDNQIPGAEALAADGLAICVRRPSDAASAALDLLNNDIRRLEMEAGGRLKIDGAGPERLAQRIFGLLQSEWKHLR